MCNLMPYLTTVIGFCVVDVELERPAFMGLDESEQIFRLVQDRVRTNNVVREAPKASLFSRTAGLNLQNMPNVFIGPLEGAEPNRNSKQALAAPHIARRDENLPNLQILVVGIKIAQSIQVFCYFSKPRP